MTAIRRGARVPALPRRIATLALAASLLALASTLATPSRAQDYPTRPITMIVPFAPGGAADITGRIMADAMSRRLGQAIVVENIGGAGGAIGSARGRNARPDGYTIGLGHMGTHAAAVATTPNLGYDPRTDFAYLGLVSTTPNIIFVNKDLPVKTLQEFIAYARQKGPALKIGHSGVGAASHITCVLFFQLIGAHPTLVPYRGFGQTINDIMSGAIDGSCDLVASVSSFVKAGSVRALVVASAARAPAVPDVPTAAEAGVPDFLVDTWTGLYAPKQTPAPILARLRAAVADSLDDPAVQQRFTSIGAAVPPPDQRGGDYMQHLVVREVDRWVDILKKAGVTPQENGK